VAAVPEQELAALHGVGPVALTTLREALAEYGLTPIAAGGSSSEQQPQKKHEQQQAGAVATG
jgi:hypothetical protein